MRPAVSTCTPDAALSRARSPDEACANQMCAHLVQGERFSVGGEVQGTVHALAAAIGRAIEELKPRHDVNDSLKHLPPGTRDGQVAKARPGVRRTNAPMSLPYSGRAAPLTPVQT